MKQFGYNTRINGFFAVLLLCAFPVAAGASEEPAPTYVDHVEPILTTYCTGCHNAEDREGDLSLETFAELEQGLADGPAFLAGQPDSSRLIRVLTGAAEPAMPPEDYEPPTTAEIAVLAAWIEAGAKGPESDGRHRPRLIVPQIKPLTSDHPPAVTALAVSPATDQLAVARFGQVELHKNDRLEFTWKELPGKVNSLSFSAQGDKLSAAGGIAGLYGQAELFDTASGEKITSLIGHRDTLYDAAFSPDGKLLATASYDGDIIIWDVAEQKAIRTLDGHNGAVFDVEFDPSGNVLASASADETVKLWKVATGQRLDTLSQPTAEQYSVAFSPDAKIIVAGGADRRLRVWRFASREQAQINPILYTRFAHDGGVVGVRFALGGEVLVTAGTEGEIRLWDTDRFVHSRILHQASSKIHDLAVSTAGDRLAVGYLDGNRSWFDLAPADPANTHTASRQAPSSPPPPKAPVSVAEREPNNAVSAAQPIDAPASIEGVITAGDDDHEDVDNYRFSALAGEQWVCEVNAACNGSPLDSVIEVLTTEGDRIERVLLQAVRDTYFTFRGKNSMRSNDFRLHQWEELRLNEYLYAAGEVTRLWHYPRGPDSGFNVYPGQGDRYTYFGTSPTAHALNEPAYVVQAHPPHADLPPTGLPVFPVYYENDDDGSRRLGTDSYLLFTAPEDGDYLVRVRDVRGFGGDSYSYKLTVRRPSPDFTATVKLDEGAISPGGGKEFSVKVKRTDGFVGAVQVRLAGLPAGFHATSPVVVEPGQAFAFGVINVSPTAEPPPEKNATSIKVIASAEIAGKLIEKELPWSTDLKLGEEPPVYVSIQTTASPTSASASHEQPLELTIAPGETISAVVQVVRKSGFTDRVEFGEELAGRNLPHGVYVDNIGLNGLMIVAGENQREFFITADSFVPETTRLFHLRTEELEHQTSWPVILHVRK